MSHRRADGGLIDRARSLAFRFDGRAFEGHPGDTLASALLAGGVRLMGRSFKYHRPRGPLTAGSEEPNALVELGTGARRTPNTRATVTELYDGLVATSQTRFPTLAFDALAISDLLSPLLPAGFYYKTFMWPAAFWEKAYEPFIRRAAGLGRLSGAPDPDTYEKAFAHCDVLVIGAGPAGLAAALAAGRAGARVILADEDFRMGGRLLGETHAVDGMPGAAWADQTMAELAGLARVRLMTRTTVFGVYDGGTYGALERVADHMAEPPAHLPRQRLWKIVAKRAVLAAGAIERPIAFANNDRPGIMTASAVRTYLNRYGIEPGRATAIFTCNDDGWLTAADLTRAGAHVAAVIDARPDGAAPPGLDGLHGVRVIRGGRVVHTRGRLGIAGLEYLDDAGARGRLAVDCLAVAGGWNPTVNLTCHMGARPQWREEIAAFVPAATPPAGLEVAGAAAGRFSTAAALADGLAAGARAAEDTGHGATEIAPPRAEDGAYAIQPLWHVAESTGRAWLDFQNDVTVKDVALAHREGFSSVEHLKRYTTLGMATDQGKTANVPALAVMAGLTGRTIAETGATMFRPPYTPVPVAAFAGHARGKEFRPTRLTPSHEWAAAAGAVFVATGAWLRAQWFARPGETHWRQSVDREVLAVRARVGVCDVSTLGKIDIQGADAAGFLNRVYANGFAKLPVGKVRYGLMLREDGFVMDDGTTARLGESHYLMTTTTANAVAVFRHLEFCRQVLWPTLDVQLISVTEQWAQFAVAGPRARDLLRRIVDPECDISNAAFPYMACDEVRVCGGVAGRLFRISFSGELAYEIAVLARYGDAMMDALMAAGEPLGAVPYGTEALGVLRIEKGHPAGPELNGQTAARDLAMGGLVSKKKDCIGKVMAQRPGLNEADRPTLAGFVPVRRDDPLSAGAHLIGLGKAAVMANDEGYLSSVAYSPHLGHSIALGFVARGAARKGERLRAVDLLHGTDTEVEIVSPHFIDPEGERLRV